MSGDERNYRAYRAITGGRSPRSEPPDFRESLAVLVKAFKSQDKAAAALGVPRRTLRRWMAGENKPAANRRAVVEGAAERLLRRGRLTPKREIKMRTATMVVIKARLRYEDEGGARTMAFKIGGGNALSLGGSAIEFAVDAFLQGATADDGPEHQNAGIFAPIADGMIDEWYRETFQDPMPDALAFDVESVTIK